MFEVLTHFRVIVGLKAAAVSQDDAVFADNVGLKHVALVGSGELLTLIQQILSRQIDYAKAADTPDPEIPGSHPPPNTWQAMVDPAAFFAARKFNRGGRSADCCHPTMTQRGR